MKRNKGLIGVTLALSMISTDVVRCIPSIYSYAESRLDDKSGNKIIGALGSPDYSDNKVKFPNAAYNEDIYGFEINTNSPTTYVLNGSEKSSENGVIKHTGNMSGKEFSEFLKSIDINLKVGGKTNISVKVGDIKSNIEGNSVTEFNGHYYKSLDANDINIDKATSIANKMYYKGLKGYLASIDNDNEYNFIMDKLNPSAALVSDGKILHPLENSEVDASEATQENETKKPTAIIVEFGGDDIETDTLVIAEGVLENKEIQPEIESEDTKLEHNENKDVKPKEEIKKKSTNLISSLSLGQYKNNSDSKTVTFPDASLRVNKRAVIAIKSNTKSKLTASYTDSGVKKDLTLSSTDPTLINITSQAQGDEILKSLAIKYEAENNNQFSIALFDIPENTTASADSIAYPEKTADKSIDGLYTTTWQGEGNAKSVVIDFGELTDVSDILVSMYDEELMVEGFNGTSWDNLGRMIVSNNTTLRHKDVPVEGSKSYSKLKLTTYSTGWSDIAEVAISKDGYQLIDLDGETPDLSEVKLGKVEQTPTVARFPKATGTLKPNEVFDLVIRAGYNSNCTISYVIDGTRKTVSGNMISIKGTPDLNFTEILRSIEIEAPKGTKLDVTGSVRTRVTDVTSSNTLAGGNLAQLNDNISNTGQVTVKGPQGVFNLKLDKPTTVGGLELYGLTDPSSTHNYTVRGKKLDGTWEELANETFTLPTNRVALNLLETSNKEELFTEVEVTGTTVNTWLAFYELDVNSVFEQVKLDYSEPFEFTLGEAKKGKYYYSFPDATVEGTVNIDKLKATITGDGEHYIQYSRKGTSIGLRNSNLDINEAISPTEAQEILRSLKIYTTSKTPSEVSISVGDKESNTAIESLVTGEPEISSGTVSIGEPVKEGNYYTFPNIEVTNSHDILGFQLKLDSKKGFVVDYMLNGERVTNYNKVINFYDRYTVEEVNEILKSLRVHSYSNAPIDLTVSLGNLKEGFVYNPNNGHYYFEEHDPYTPNTNPDKYIEDANELSIYGAQGYPATVTDPFENDFVKSKPLGAGNSFAHQKIIGGLYNRNLNQIVWIGGPEKGKAAEFIPEGSLISIDKKLTSITDDRWFTDSSNYNKSRVFEFGDVRMLAPTTKVSDKVTLEGISIPEEEKSSGTVSIGEPIKEGNYYTFPNIEVANSHDILGFKLQIETSNGFMVDYMLNGERLTNYNKAINFYDRYTVEEVNEILKSLRVHSYSNAPINLTVTLGNLKEGYVYNPINGHYYFEEYDAYTPNTNPDKYIGDANKLSIYGEQGYPTTVIDPFENDFIKSKPMGQGNSNSNEKVIGGQYNKNLNQLIWIGGPEKGKAAEFIPEGSLIGEDKKLASITDNRWITYGNDYNKSRVFEFGDERMLPPTTRVSDKVTMEGINIPEEEKSSGSISIGTPIKEDNYYTFPDIDVKNTHDVLGFKINISSKNYFMSSYVINGNRVNNYNATINFYERYTVEEVNDILKTLRIYSYSNEPIKFTITLGNLQEGYAYNPINGHYYFEEHDPYTPNVGSSKYIEAASKLTLYGEKAYPATITTPFENEFVSSKPLGAGNTGGYQMLIGAIYNKDTGTATWIGGPEEGSELEYIPEDAEIKSHNKITSISWGRWLADYSDYSKGRIFEFGDSRMLPPTTKVTSAEVELEGIPAKNNIELKEPKISDNTITFPDSNVIVEHPMELNIDYDVKPGTKITTEYSLDGTKVTSNESRITTRKITQNQASEVLNSLEVTTDEPKTLKIDIQMLNATTEDGNPVKDNSIIDRESPIFTFTGDKIEVIRGNNYDFYTLLSANDDIDNDVSDLVKLSFMDKDKNPVDKIDTSNYGEWIARLEVEDKAGNKATKDIPVSIIKDPALITERIKLSGNKLNPDGVTLNWTKTNNVENYKVYKKTKDADYREIFEVSNPKGLSLFKRSRNTDDMSFIDSEIKDTTAPDISHYLHVLLSEKTVRFEFPIDDFADDVEYLIGGFDNEDYIDAYSNSIKIKSKASGFKGFSYVKDSNPITEVDETIDTTNNKFRFNDVQEDEYLHIAAIDNNGNKSETLHIKLLDGTYNNTPSISVPGLNQVINKNGEFDPLKGVTAYDFEDGDLTEKIVVTGAVDTTKSGTQSIVYTVEDTDGFSTSLTVNIHIAGDMDLKVRDEYNSLNLDWTKEPKANKYKIFRSSADGTDLEEILEITDIDTISYLDAAAVDTRVPNIKSVQEIKNTEDAEATLKVSTKDFSSTYRYFIQAVDDHNNYVNSSEIKHGTSATGVVGYSYTIDDIRDTAVDEHMDTTDLASIDLKNNFGKILHIRAIDGNGNASIVKHHIIGGRYDTDLIPVIYGLDTLRVKVGEEIDFMKGVTASDVEDGDITKDIKVIGAVNNKENNKYKVTYSVTDSDENTRTVDREVIVKGEYPNTVAKANKSSNKISLTWEKNSIDTGSNITYEIQRFNKELDGYKAINVDTGITSFEDPYSSDLLGPIVNKIEPVKLAGTNKVKFIVDSEDVGVEYHYKIVHRLDDYTIIGESNEAKASIIGTVKGYSYALSNDMDYKVDNKINITNTKEFEVDPGDYKYIHFAPIDSYGNKGQQVTVSFVDVNNAPELRGVSEKSIQLGSKFDNMKGVTAYDKEDGDLTKDIKVTGEVNPFKAGSYTLRYSVKDKKGAETVRTRTVKVIPPEVIIPDVPTEEMSGIPVVYMNPTKLYLLVNSKDYSLMSGIAVKDKEDGDITNKVKYTTDLNINKVGKYTATYTVSDSDKNTVKWDREIVVVPSKDALPVLPEDVTDRAPWIKAKKISIPWGKDFNVMTGVVAKDFEDGDITHLVRSKGNVNVGKAGFYTVTYRVTDSFGNTTFATRLVEVRPKGNNNPSGDFPPSNPDWGKNDKWEKDKVNKLPKPPTQPDQPSGSTGDKKPEINIDINGDGKPDINLDIDGDGNPDINVDTDGDKKPDINIDTDGDKKPDINVDTDGDKKPDINIDTDGDKKPDINIDINGDGKPDINIDTDGDKKPDINIDTNGDGKADTNIDLNGDGKVDEKDNPKTGDLMKIEIYSAAILASIGCIFRYRRRNKNTLK